MSSALIDTGLLLDYLRGEPHAQQALAPYRRRAISVVTWVELMALSPPEVAEPTRGFLRSFERLSINEAIGDEALRLLQARPGLGLPRAMRWATARTHQLDFLTNDATHLLRTDTRVVLSHRRGARSPA